MTARAAAPTSESVFSTRKALDSVEDANLVDLTRLGVPQVRALKQEVAEIFPASTLPAFLLQGLLQLEGRTLPQERVAADLRMLFRGSTQIGLYGTFLAAPALVLHGYQRLLSLAGKDIESAFPDGPWQFYTEFGLREDAARHCVETLGFQRAAAQASELDAATCWVYAAMRALLAYDDLLANEWHERTLLRAVTEALRARAVALLGGQLPRKLPERERLLGQQTEALRRVYRLERLERGWAVRRPYGGPPGEPLGDYPTYRRRRFHAYMEQALRHLTDEAQADLERFYAERCECDLAPYREQLTLLTTLQADGYQERRTPLPLHMAHVALLVGGRYHLLDVCDRDEAGHLLVFPDDGEGHPTALPLVRAPDGGECDRANRPVQIDRRGRVWVGGALLGRLRPPPPERVKGLVEAILRHARAQGHAHPDAGEAPPLDMLLAQAPRSRQRDLRMLLGDRAQGALAALRFAPIVLNWDGHDSALPLTELRRTQRGCGDHGLTLLRTERSMVFDQSHIFFDALWGMALAEIITGFAATLYPLVAKTHATRAAAPTPLDLRSTAAFRIAATEAVSVSPVEAAAETSAVDLQAINGLRRRMQLIELQLTVNDLLLLARCLHAAGYRPGPAAQAAMEAITGLPGGAVLTRQITRDLEAQRELNPTLLIPMDASGVNPRQRIFPATFRSPVPELPSRLNRCDELLRRIRQQPDAALTAMFERERRALCAELLTFEALLQALKEVTMRGESFTSAALRLLAHLPAPMQSLVDQIPQKIGLLNEIIKGREVFSNVGQAVSGSSLARFASSRDDGETKLLVWGVMSSANGRLYITMRDFRPHVARLTRLGRPDLARALAQDYLDAYATCANDLVWRLQRVLAFQ